MFPGFYLSSLTHKELIPYWNKWYPTETGFKKIVPRDLNITPKTLLHWFLDDGSTSYRNRGGKQTKQVRITFCTESFNKEDQEFLCEQLNSKYHLKARTIKCQTGTKYRISIPQSMAPDFFEVIGPSPVDSLAYKWKN